MAADSNASTTVTTYKGQIWAGNYADNTVEILNPTAGTAVSVAVGATNSAPLGIAIDGNSNAWVTTYTAPGLYQVAAAGTTPGTLATAASPSGIANTTNAPASTATTSVAIGGVSKPRYVAVDGAGNVWVANNGYGTLVEYNPTYTNSTTGAYLSPYYGFSPSIGSVTANLITKYAITTGSPTVATFTSANSYVAGQVVTLSGFPTATFLNGQTVTIISTGLSSSKFEANIATHATVASTTEAGYAVTSLNAANQSLFTCTGTTTVTCSVVGSPMTADYPVAIDRAGSVWTVSNNNGTLEELIGTAAPTDPVLGDGAYGASGSPAVLP
jgi:hypothetical protein